MSCTTCYKIKIEDCAESVTVAGALLPNTTYTWVIADKFGHEWSDTVTTDADGSFTIDLTDAMFPAGLFNQFSNLTLEVFLYATQCEAATMTFCDVAYTCVNFSVNPGNYVYTNPAPRPAGCDVCVKYASVEMTIDEFMDTADGQGIAVVSPTTGSSYIIIGGFIKFKELSDYGAPLSNGYALISNGTDLTSFRTNVPDLVNVYNHVLGEDYSQQFVPYTVASSNLSDTQQSQNIDDSGIYIASIVDYRPVPIVASSVIVGVYYYEINTSGENI